MASITSSPFRALLVSTYELGRQPFGLASPAAWLQKIGASVRCIDLSRQKFEDEDFQSADFVAFYLPMHTATRLAGQVIPRVSRLNPRAHLCAYGLYATVNEEYLRGLGVKSLIGGEFEEDLTSLVHSLMQGHTAPDQPSLVSLRRQQFLVPDRSALPVLQGYSQLNLPDGTRRVVGYTEASRGCKHLCRHCPIVPVYEGKFRVVQKEVVLQDIRHQVAQGARHITFGDPDFFNGIGHAVALVRSLHAEFPNVSYDVTIKIEHLLKHAQHIATLKDAGCSFIISAVESVDDHTLAVLDKGHTRADFIRAVALCREVGLPMAPTFVTFTPWLTLAGFRDLLELIAELDLVSAVAPVQWAIRLLIPNGSLLLDLPEVRTVLKGFDETALSYRWAHADPRVDELQQRVERLVRDELKRGSGRSEIFQKVWQLSHCPKDYFKREMPVWHPRPDNCTIPYLTEPWFC